MATTEQKKRTATPRKASAVIEAASVGPDDDKYLVVRKAGTTSEGRDFEWTAAHEGRFRLREIPGYLLVKMGELASEAEHAAATDDPDGKAGIEQAAMLSKLMRRAIHPGDFHRFEEYMIDSDPAIGMAELARDVVGQMASAAAGDRPTEPSS